MACTIYTFEKGADVGKIMSQIFENRKQNQKPEKLSWALDGHFWLQDKEGNIIESTPIPKTERCFQKGKFYYKASEPHIQKLAIEMMYRDSEKRFGYCRESREWENHLMFHEYKYGACFHNALAYNFTNDDKYKLVFGILGMYHDKKIVESKYDNPVPAKSVFWCYGCSKYTKISDYVRKANDESVSDYYTLELWENRDNKTKIINV
jgi:hypothetical protein